MTSASMDQRASLTMRTCRDADGWAAFSEASGWQRMKSPDGAIGLDLIMQTSGIYSTEALANEIALSAEDLGRGGIRPEQNVGQKAVVAQLLDKAIAMAARLPEPAQDVFWGGHPDDFADPEGRVFEIAWNPLLPLGPAGEFQRSGGA